MIKRYSSTPIFNRWDGKRVYTTTQYPTIQPQDSDAIIISQDGDYLDALAYTYYGDPSLWIIIALCNNLGKGRLSVPPGLQIRIPQNVNTIINQFNSLNLR
jgi:phage tail protein X